MSCSAASRCCFSYPFPAVNYHYTRVMLMANVVATILNSVKCYLCDIACLPMHRLKAVDTSAICDRGRLFVSIDRGQKKSKAVQVLWLLHAAPLSLCKRQFSPQKPAFLRRKLRLFVKCYLCVNFLSNTPDHNTSSHRMVTFGVREKDGAKLLVSFV